MKNLRLALIITIFIAVIFAFSVSAEETKVQGSLCETVTYRIVDFGSEDKPSYTLYVEGTGSFTGLDTAGNSLKYDTRKNSIYAEHSEYITKIEVGDGIEEIGSYGLAFLSKATELVIPESLTTLGNAALQDCNLLQNVRIRGKDHKGGFDLTCVTAIKNYAFSGCYSMERIDLSESLTGLLGKQCFANCRKLESITVPGGITVIGEECFKNCSALYYVFIKGAPTIDSRSLGGATYAYIVGEDEMLYGEVKEKGLRWGGTSPADLPFAPDPEAVDSGSAGSGLYWQIKKNEKYTADAPRYDMLIDGEGKDLVFNTVWNKATNFKNYKEGSAAAYLSEIVNVYIECDITSISGNFFTGMVNLERIMIPRSLTEFKGAVFEHAVKLESIYLDGTEPQKGVFDLSFVQSIAAYCFDGCKALERVIFSEELKNESIETETFKGCTSLVTFTVPRMITNIAKNAFLDCERLTEVIFEQDASIHQRAFDGCNSLKTFRGANDSEAEQFAASHGIEFLYPCSVALRSVGSKKLIGYTDVIAGQGLKSFSVGGDICLLYTDPEGTVAYNVNDPITETTTLYARPVYRLTSLSVRADGAVGLRAAFGLISKEGNGDYEIVAAGALASKDRGTSNALLERSMNYIEDRVFYGEGVTESSHVLLPSSGTLYTLCATGFEDEDGYISERLGEKLCFRGYLTVRDRKSGEEITFYTDMRSASLYELGASQGIEEISKHTECEKAPATRREMLETVERIEMGELGVLLAGEPTVKDIDFFNDYLAKQYDETGDAPALVRFDVNHLFDLDLGTEKDLKALAAEIREYASEGGSVLLRLRPDNPTSEGTSGGRLSGSDWQDLFVTGTPQRIALLRQLGQTGMLIQFLKEEGVCVYVNLMQDIASENKWWCAPTEKGGDTDEAKIRYKNLWKDIVTYFEVDCSLDNIVWVYEGGNESEEYYPGSDFADIYGSSFESSSGKTTLSQMK